MDNDPFSPTPIQESDPLRDFATDYLLQKQRASEGPAPTQPRADIEFSRSVQPPSPLMGREPKGRRPREIAPVDTEFSHPWKLTVNGAGTVDIAAGVLLYPDIAYADGTLAELPHTSTLAVLEYAGATGQSLSGYIYAKCAATAFAFYTTTAGGSNASYVVYPTDITIVSSASAITSATADTDFLYVPIGRVSGGAVVAQYLTSNPVVGYTYTDA